MGSVRPAEALAASPLGTSSEHSNSPKPPAARGSRRAEVTTGRSPGRAIRSPHRVRAATSAWSSARASRADAADPAVGGIG